MAENKDENFANARAVRNYFEKIVAAQANRIASADHLSDDEIAMLTAEDALNIVGL